MKKLIATIFSGILFFLANCQTAVGVKAGLNFAKLKFGNVDYRTGFNYTSSSNVGGYGGLFLNHKFSPHIAIQPEALFSTESSKITQNPTGTSGHDNFSFVNIPVLLQYVTASGLFIETGPQVSFMLSSKETFNGTTYDVKPNDNTTNFSWCIGAGYGLGKLVNGLGVNARYQISISNINKEAGSSIKKSVFSIGLFYYLQHKK
jgi:hypothetical protein